MSTTPPITASRKSQLRAQLGVKQVDLYLIHNPWFIKDLEQDWREFEKIKEAGLSK